MNKPLLDELWKRHVKAEKEFDKVMDHYIDTKFKKDTNNRNILHIEFLNMIDVVQEKRHEMIRAGNLWREFKREQEDG